MNHPPTTARDIHVSIISHGHGSMVESLLAELSQLPCASRLQLTLISNIPETLSGRFDTLSYPVTYRVNPEPLGFGANHNQSFRLSPVPEQRRYFLVLNPDVRLQQNVIESLVARLSEQPDIGVIAPKVQNSAGGVEDSARPLPTISGLFKKLFKKLLSTKSPAMITPASSHAQKAEQPDWVAGMFMLFREQDYRQLNGFDERFHLYYEDVDICCRIWLKGMTVYYDSSVSIIHDAQRDSHRQIKFLIWHLGSILRFFSSSVYRQCKVFHRKRV